MVKTNREDAKVPHKGWSEWKKAMVLDNETVLTSCRRRRNKNVGYYCDDMKTAFDHYDCGIYEWKAVNPHGRDYVVYIGSTHRISNETPKLRRKTAKDLKKKIMEYCKSGSKKKDVINKVLRDGYEMHVRVKPIAGDRKRSEDEENKLLKKYNYAWNKRRNQPYRGDEVPPCPP